LGPLRYFSNLFAGLRGASRGRPKVERGFNTEARRERGEFPDLSLAPRGTWITIGGLSYMVSKIEWSERLTGERAMDREPDAAFLIIQVTVRNDDREPRTIPFFGLVGEEGAEFEVWDKGWFIENRIGRFERINPGVAKSGTVIFDVPKLPRYHLKIPKGLWSKEYALIRLEDEADGKLIERFP
jgi:hypothetical protein